MNTPEDHSQCRTFLEARALEAGTEVWAVATDPGPPWESFVCPHRVRYWLVPADDLRGES